MKVNKVSLTEGVIWKQIMLFCFPIMLGTLFQQLYNTVDVIVIGQFVGPTAIASVGGSSGMVINLVVGLFVGISSGVTVIVSQNFGAKKYSSVKQAIQTATALSLVGGIVLTILGILFTPTILELMNTPAETMRGSISYLRIYFLGITFVFLYNVGSAILRALGDSKRPLYYLMVCSAINVVVDILLVAVFGMGVEGVAIATAVSQGVSAILTLRALMKLEDECKLIFSQIRFHGKLFNSIIWIGLPAAFQSIMNSLSGMVMTVAVNGLGTAAVAGNTSYAKLDQIFWMVSGAFSVSVATFVGQNFGAGKYKRMRKGVWVCLGLDVLISAVVTAFFMIVGRYLFYLFTNDIQVITQGVEVLKAIAPYYVIVAFFEIFISALRGMGNVIMPMVINIVGICGVRVLWIKVILPLLPTQGIYDIIISCPVSWILTAIAMVIYYFIQNKKYQKMYI